VQAKEAGVDLIVFPEMTDTGYSMPVIQAHAAPWTRGLVPQLQEIARDLSIAIISGVSEREGESIYNSQILCRWRWQRCEQISKGSFVRERANCRAQVLFSR